MIDLEFIPSLEHHPIYVSIYNTEVAVKIERQDVPYLYFSNKCCTLKLYKLHHKSWYKCSALEIKAILVTEQYLFFYESKVLWPIQFIASFLSDLHYSLLDDCKLSNDEKQMSSLRMHYSYGKPKRKKYLQNQFIQTDVRCNDDPFPKTAHSKFVTNFDTDYYIFNTYLIYGRHQAGGWIILYSRWHRLYLWWSIIYIPVPP